MTLALLADTALTELTPKTLPMSLMHTALYGILGIVLALIAFKLFDWLTPGDMQKEILENKNVAAAIVVGAYIVGVCYIIAIAVHG
jgi:uncharacterized membrane protein YjfL (UPF0719 family)